MEMTLNEDEKLIANGDGGLFISHFPLILLSCKEKLFNSHFYKLAFSFHF